ncbi:MAG: hypothetical protein KDC49_22685 [Saprospiraceae bacterium]|nr:hypothetical protein [Saprospiraceae bacterium]
MIYKSLKKYGQDKNWYRTEDSVFGLYKGFCYNIFQSGIMSSPGYKIILCRTGALDEGQVKNMQQYLSSNKSKFGYNVFEIGQNFIRVTFYENLKMTKISKLEAFIENCTEQLIHQNVGRLIESENISSSDYGFYNHSGEGVVLNNDDFKRIRSEIQQVDGKEEVERSSYLKGFVGAVLFSIPGIILWVLFAIFLEMLSTGFGFIMAFAAYFGYEKFKGKLGPLTKWILIVVTIISILLANLSTIYYQLSGYGVTRSEFISMLQNDEQIISAFKKDAVLGLIIGLIGWLWIIFGLKTKNRFIQPAERL